MKDATYQIQFEVREYVAGNPKWWKDYALTGIPDNVLIDCSTGIIIGREMRFRLVSTLEKLL